MSEMVESGCKAAVLEVAGEAMAHRSFEGIAFHAAVATDVGAPRGFPEEIVLQRRRAKARLFRQVVPGGVAVVNADDPNAEILGAVNLDARRVAFAMEPAARPELGVDVSARIVRLDAAGTRMILHGFDREISVGLPLVGPRAAALRAWPRQRWRGPWRSIVTPSSPGWNGSRRLPATSRRLTRARTSTSGSMPPQPPRHSARPWPP